MRQLDLGMHTALLDGNGQLLLPSQRWLWNELGIVPGLLHDSGVSARVGGMKITAFRDLTVGECGSLGRVMVGAGRIRHGARIFPAALRVGQQVTVHACRE